MTKVDKKKIKNITVGRLGAPHARKGHIRVWSYTKPKEAIFSYSPLRVAFQEIVIMHYQLIGKSFVAKLQGVDSYDQAVVLRHADLIITREQLADLNEGDYYWEDLKGLQVLTDKGVFLGFVVNLQTSMVGDLLEVKHPNTAFVHLIPYDDQVICSVDLKNQQMTVHMDECQQDAI